jgi:hypothetical protein
MAIAVTSFIYRSLYRIKQRSPTKVTTGKKDFYRLFSDTSKTIKKYLKKEKNERKHKIVSFSLSTK